MGRILLSTGLGHGHLSTGESAQGSPGPYARRECRAPTWTLINQPASSSSCQTGKKSPGTLQLHAAEGPPPTRSC